MYKKILIFLVLVISLKAFSFQEEPVSIYLIGDSTMADYSDNYEEGKDYMKTRYPITGWGQVF